MRLDNSQRRAAGNGTGREGFGRLRHRIRWVWAAVLLVGTLLAAGSPAAWANAGSQRWVFDPSVTEVIYEVNETFLSQMVRATAVGVTTAVEGEVEMNLDDWSTLKVSPVRVDISQFTSDQPRRDQRIRREWLESERYPIAVFVPTAFEGLPEHYVDGEEIAVVVHGELTVRDVTRPVTWEGVIRLSDGMLQGNFQTDILMTDFGFDPPSILGVLRAENEVRLTFNFTAVPVM